MTIRSNAKFFGPPWSGQHNDGLTSSQMGVQELLGLQSGILPSVFQYQETIDDDVESFNIKQRGPESLWDYIRHFNRTILEVYSATPDLMIGAFTSGLREGDFFRSLIKKHPEMFDELLPSPINQS
ncbi:hypothetical protein F511_39722 [Dorcoceras hygrometricum]|uniref:Retrotransposon gag domain-containing protein n=1 Tax=Dorcoceras hygrometricum TaxID=472368 RepID=A0A2Z7D4G0_9LAMI|nr:hypothetical protein F511_39722 [Dorcoceras hygrometricum]